jgi:hypothetical protein
VSAAGADPHAYFNSLVARSDYWKSFSFRDAAALTGKKYLTYDPSHDTDPHRQDAAKIVIPAFYTTTTTVGAISETDTSVEPADKRSTLWPAGRVIRIDNEIMTVAGRTVDAAGALTAIKLTRAQSGTPARAHAAGAVVAHATNTLQSKLQIPLGTEDGHSYFFVWDSYWTDSYVGAGQFNHKAFQFFSGGSDPLGAIWFEPQATYNKVAAPALASFQVRSYNLPGGDTSWLATDGNKLGPAAAGGEPLKPYVPFFLMPNTWTRFFVRIDQRSGDYDLADVWVADENRDPVKVLTQMPVSVRPTGRTPNSIASFQAEFNSSTDSLLRTDLRDLVAYVRNFVALRDVADPTRLLVRPSTGLDLPTPPSNLRIIR